MPPNLKKTKEARQAQQKLCKRRRYAEIKNDPDLLAIAKEKRREKYLRDKEAKKVKSISDQSSRDQREQRKKWKENSRRYRQNKKEVQEPTFESIQIKAVSGNQEETNPKGTHYTQDPLCENCAKLKKINVKAVRNIKKITRTVAAFVKRDKNRCRVIQRLKKKLQEAQIETREVTSQDLSDGTNKVSELDTKKCLVDSIKKFYVDDVNSSLCAGKKEFVTRNKKRMQKRYLCLPLKDLHKKFLSETKLRVSYSFFCKHRPFWVLFPKTVNRDTCLCSVHANMQLLIEAMNKSLMLNEKNYDQVLVSMCCDSRDPDCLQRVCDACKSNQIELKECANVDLTFYQWQKVSKEVGEGKKKQTLTEKKKITVSSAEAVTKFKKDLAKFLHHTYKIVHQYKIIRNLKENLNIQEACVHVDFSENYSLKFAEEVQSFHFGGSRQQVSLHTAVIYTHSFSTGQITPSSMCTISDCLRHDAPAIWAHLVPLIQEVIKLNPLVDTLHFLSDSPSSQYRNKYMFYIMSQISDDFPQIIRITWNYSESGHGKGAPDGVGATLKRTADRMVMYGTDVGTFDQFYDLIVESVKKDGLNVMVKKIEENDVFLKQNLIPATLKAFKGTFSVYQVLWDKTELNTTLRTMSCFDCTASTICVHGKHLGVIQNMHAMQKENVEHKSTLTSPSPDTKSDTAQPYRVRILSDMMFNINNNKLAQ